MVFGIVLLCLHNKILKAMSQELIDFTAQIEQDLDLDFIAPETLADYLIKLFV